MTTLADAVKHAGHPATVHQIRADLYIRLLDGRLDGLDHHQMITAMLTDAHTDAEAQTADPAVGANAEAESDRLGAAGSPAPPTAAAARRA